MGFLDRKDRIIDVALTAEGRQQYAAGKLRFVYFAVFDDGIDYDPWTPSGILSDQDRDDLILSSPMFEASVIPEAGEFQGFCRPQSFVFTAQPGYQKIPELVSGSDSSLGMTVQQKTLKESSVPMYLRAASTAAAVNISLTGDAENSNQGARFKVFEQISSGNFVETDVRLDLQNALSFGPYIVAKLDK